MNETDIPEGPIPEARKRAAVLGRQFDLTAAFIAVCAVVVSTIVFLVWGLTVGQGWGLLGLPLFILAAVAVPAALVVILVALVTIKPRGRQLLTRIAVLTVLTLSLISYTWLMIPLRAFDLGLRTRISRVVDLYALRASALQLLRSQSDDRRRLVETAELPEAIRRLGAEATWVRKKNGDGYVFIWWGHSPLGRYGLMITPAPTGNRYLAVWPDGMSGYWSPE